MTKAAKVALCAEARERAKDQSASRPMEVEKMNRCCELDVSHVYNAIKLTNYYTNLLQQKQQHLTSMETNSTANNGTTGESWRSQQLAYQIPHQDIKLLAAPMQHSINQSGDNQTAELMNERLFCGPQQQATSVNDEVQFIRGQRKLASQYKASLYYLNPSSLAAKSSTNSQVQQRSASSGEESPKCFKVSLRRRFFVLLLSMLWHNWEIELRGTDIPVVLLLVQPHPCLVAANHRRLRAN